MARDLTGRSVAPSNSLDSNPLRGSVNRRVANVTTVGQEAIQSFGEMSGKKSSQPIDGSSKLLVLRKAQNEGVSPLAQTLHPPRASPSP